MANLSLTVAQVRPLDGAYVRPIESAEDLTVGDLVQVTNSGILKANNTTAAGVAGALGIVVSGSEYRSTGVVKSGEMASVVLWGPVFLTVSLGLTSKGTYYTSATAGKIADATSTNARIIGNSLSSEILLLYPSAA